MQLLDGDGEKKRMKFNFFHFRLIRRFERFGASEVARCLERFGASEIGRRFERFGASRFDAPRVGVSNSLNQNRDKNECFNSCCSQESKMARELELVIIQQNAGSSKQQPRRTPIAGSTWSSRTPLGPSGESMASECGAYSDGQSRRTPPSGSVFTDHAESSERWSGQMSCGPSIRSTSVGCVDHSADGHFRPLHGKGITPFAARQRRSGLLHFEVRRSRQQKRLWQRSW